MDDLALANYIPSYGDRIALFNFCKNQKPVSKRKLGLREKLRHKMKLRRETRERGKENIEHEKVPESEKGRSNDENVPKTLCHSKENYTDN